MDEVIVGPGTKPIIYWAISALVDEGDEVIYPNPGYPIYESLINYVGGKAVALPLLEEKDFSFDIEDLKKLVNKNTKMIVLNSPQNPTGGVLSKGDLEAIAEIADRYDIWILSDEIYSRIIYGKEFVSIASFDGMKKRTILVDGFSKIYSMTGWRLGYGIMPPDIAEIMTSLATNIVTCTTTFVQMAGIEGYSGSQKDTVEMVRRFEERRNTIVEGLNNIKGVNCLKPQGAFYVFPNVTQVCRDMSLKNSNELQQKLLHEGNVAVLPRTSFGSRNQDEKEEYIRLSHAEPISFIKIPISDTMSILLDILNRSIAALNE